MTHSMFHRSWCAERNGGLPAVWRRLGFALVLPLLFAALAWAQNFGNNSCIGNDACAHNTGKVKNDACNGDEAQTPP
jgi:hypothetical protein